MKAASWLTVTVVAAVAFATLVSVSSAALTSCDCNSEPEDFWFGWDCEACTCPPKLGTNSANSTSSSAYSGGVCANDVCPRGQYVCCTEDQAFPDLTKANRDDSCGRLLYFPYVVACNAWSIWSRRDVRTKNFLQVEGLILNKILRLNLFLKAI